MDASGEGEWRLEVTAELRRVGRGGWRRAPLFLLLGFRVVRRRHGYAGVGGTRAARVFETPVVDLRRGEPRVETAVVVARGELLEQSGGALKPLRVDVMAASLCSAAGAESLAA